MAYTLRYNYTSIFEENEGLAAEIMAEQYLLSYLEAHSWLALL